jgi:hypothetical protein
MKKAARLSGLSMFSKKPRQAGLASAVFPAGFPAAFLALIAIFLRLR